MKPSIIVLQHTESFGEIWSRFSSPIPVVRVDDPDSADESVMAQAHGVILSVAGAEDVAIPAVRDLVARRPIPIAVVGSMTDYRIAIALLQEGAQNYFALPPDLGGLRAWIVSLGERVVARERAASLAQDQRKLFSFNKMIGQCPPLLDALEKVRMVIPRESATVLIMGETGTGKDLLANAIHTHGRRAAKPFVPINCAALPANLLEAELFGYEKGAFTDARTAKPGLFEVANGGTLFLDEIGDLSLDLQGKLLRVLEEKQVRRLGSVRDRELDVRIVAATHVNLNQAVKDGRFRIDLYHRLNLAPIHLPPLRERGRDILLLARQFLAQAGKDYEVEVRDLSPAVEQALLRYSWPGNIRELRNVIERAVLFGSGDVRLKDLQLEEDTHAANGALPFPAEMAVIERAAAGAMLELCRGNKSEAARRLGISRRHLYTLIEG